MTMFLKRLALLGGIALCSFAAAETCTTPAEMSPADKSALDQAADRFNQAFLRGDTNALRAAAIPSIAQQFDAVTKAVTQAQPQVQGGQSKTVAEYLLNQDQAVSGNADFYCGVLNDPNRIHVAFSIPNLPRGNFAFVMTEITGGRTAYRVSYVLQQDGGQWKLAGFFPKPAQAAGRDGVWYWKQARDYKSKNENHNAWFYLLTAQDLLQPVGFMTSTNNLDKLFNEQQAIQPKDVPTDKPATFTGPDGKNWQLTEMFPTTDDKGNLVLVVKYAVPDVSNPAQMFQSNQAVANALTQKYPELKQAFASLVPRATAPNGQDFGSEFKVGDLK